MHRMLRTHIIIFADEHKPHLQLGDRQQDSGTSGVAEVVPTMVEVGEDFVPDSEKVFQMELKARNGVLGSKSQTELSATTVAKVATRRRTVLSVSQKKVEQAEPEPGSSPFWLKIQIASPVVIG